jgi:DNA-binding CsgD family transcriptional regulator
MIFGRDVELARIDTLLRGASSGAGEALVVAGEAGIGKTVLLDAARQRASVQRVLATCGVEAEANLPFAALAQLLEPLLDRIDRLPAPQAAALRGALALAPPAPGDRFAVCVAALGVLKEAARETPLLVVVDDAHWLDPASLECLAFAARRLAGQRVALLFGLRDGEHAPRGLTALAAVRPAPLADDDARRLLDAHPSRLASGVCDAVIDAARGNPLALQEIAAGLTAEERAGRTPLPEPLRSGERSAAVFERRIGALTRVARDALLVAAAAGGGKLAVVRAACEEAGIEARALEEAESAGLVRVAAGDVAFVHPLARSAAYHGADPPRRRTVHRQLAAVLTGERRAWHLAAAADGPDEEAARALQEAGAAASQRRGYVEAALAHERSAALSSDPEARGRRLLRACNGRVAAGQLEHANRLLEEAIALGTSIATDPRVLHTRSTLLIGIGEVGPGFTLLKELAEGAAQVADPVTAAFVTADTAMAALITGDCRETHDLAEQAAALLGDRGDARVRSLVLVCLAAGRAFRGEAAASREVMQEVDRLLVELDPLDWLVALRTQALAMHVWVALEEYERARRQGDAVLAAVDHAAALTARANPLSHGADAAYRLAEWDLASREAAEAIALAEETGYGEALVRALAVRARLAAARGLEAEARADADRVAQLAERAGMGATAVHCRATVAFLDVGLGRVEAAIARLESLRADVEGKHGLVHATIIPWRPDLCEAYVMSGRLEDARREALTLEREAAATALPASRALAARCRGLVARDDFAAHFEQALAYDRERPMPFERARTLLLYGSRLHRARRRAEARRSLREAEEIFAGLGATPWRERTLGELRAAGAVRRAERHRDRDALTAQEVRVAAAIARGLTNRQAGAELFLSPKTIDFHLRQIYGKLAIRSRAELARIAAQRGWLDTGG